MVSCAEKRLRWVSLMSPRGLDDIQLTHVVLPRQRLQALRVMEQVRRLLRHLPLARLLRRLFPVLPPMRWLLFANLLQLRWSSDLSRSGRDSVRLIPTSWCSVRLVDGPEVQVLVDLGSLVDDAGDRRVGKDVSEGTRTLEEQICYVSSM